MSATTMHFGPEWMRTKHQPLSRSQPPPSPPPSNLSNNSGVSTYSALVSATPPASSEASDDAHPFRYSKDDLLRIYQEGGGKLGLGLEVERWEGVVREAGAEPIALREMTDAERKLFSGPLNSEIRRRPSQSTDFLSPLNTSALERPRLAHSASSTANSPLRERFGSLKRRDSGATGSSDTTMSNLPRKPSLSTLQAPLSPRDMSPRTRVGYTSNFDGVLNNGESWVARRRISESSLKTAAAASGRDGTDTQSNKASEIREEKEDEQIGTQSLQGDNHNFLASSSPRLRSEDSRPYDTVGGASDNSNNATQPNLFGANGALNTYGNNHVGVGPPPGLVDLAAVEWTYKDPTGQVQGPFRADLMQKWYNDGYFSSDLPMRRVLYDNDWTTVEQLVLRANGGNIFLSPLISPISTTRVNGSPLPTYPSLDSVFNEPYQPAPVRSMRTSTLESYLTGGSLPSDSPSSSVGASHFGNPSPDPAAYGGRDSKVYFGNEHLASRLTPFGSQDHMPSFPERRPIGHEYSNNNINLHHSQLQHQQQPPSFANFVADRDPNFNGYAYNPNQLAHDPWVMSSNNIPQTMYTGGRDHAGRPEHVHHDSAGRGFNAGAVYANDSIGKFNGHISGTNESSHGYTQYDSAGQATFQAVQQDQLQLASSASDLVESSPQSASLSALRNLNIDPTPSKSSQNSSPAFAPAPIQSPWKSLVGLNSPSVSQVVAPATLASWNTEPSLGPTPENKNPVVNSHTLHGNDASNNGSVSKTSAETFIEPPVAPKSQKKAVSPAENEVHSRNPSDSVPASEASAPLSNQAATKSSNKLPSPLPMPQVAPVEAPAAPKTAWAKEEEGKKKKGPTASISLREIQEAEAKKLESRKAAEREKERLARVATIVESKEDLQPFTTSWGLPTSQAGSRVTAPVREVAAPSVQTPTAAPVWTTPVKAPTVKKTMKEIQEEEEIRKKNAAAKEVVAPVIAKRGYAESTTKVAAPSITSATSNVWTTVGPSGKTTTPTVPSPVRTITQGSTAGPTAPLSRASNSPAPRAVVNSALKTRPVTTKTEELSDVPSHDFLKWLTDSLKGLNSSVNVEEIVSMLLSFPLDPDATTIEIISDTIYSNSTTLDGRRFASEFVAKRKADARSKGSSTSGKAKPVSIADVVKATPKTTQQEWGFKVVNKKKKGGRS